MELIWFVVLSLWFGLVEMNENRKNYGNISKSSQDTVQIGENVQNYGADEQRTRQAEVNTRNNFVSAISHSHLCSHCSSAMSFSLALSTAPPLPPHVCSILHLYLYLDSIYSQQNYLHCSDVSELEKYDDVVIIITFQPDVLRAVGVALVLDCYGHQAKPSFLASFRLTKSIFFPLIRLLFGIFYVFSCFCWIFGYMIRNVLV